MNMFVILKKKTWKALNDELAHLSIEWDMSAKKIERLFAELQGLKEAVKSLTADQRKLKSEITNLKKELAKLKKEWQSTGK